MKLFILDADNSKDMEDISEELSSKKFKIIEKDDNFILMMKRRYGNLLIHAVCLIIALSFLGPLIFVNVAYFAYSYLWASPHVLITTEKVDDEGNPLEFNDMDEVLNAAFAIL
ncbi:MAG: hypothetical protein E7Z77_06480 [Methanobrevibacter sp.]|uniref:hypothetical protein n=1 Tax=Methanobrevibacter sp. TaxID=66852 RepID=UPI0025E27739|nr:hypothetical protein [Methanobrevibacter sp.]MBE6509049.1 hypothetical protein [Methanobrevibacter sp.]